MSKRQDEHERMLEFFRNHPGCRSVTEVTETTLIFRSPRADADEAEDETKAGEESDG